MQLLDRKLHAALDQVFHAPFAPGQDTVLKPGQFFPVASICDTYPHQNDLAREITVQARARTFDKIILNSGDIGTGMLPIGIMQLLRLTSEAKLGSAFNDRIILDPRSKHTGMDLTLSWQHGAGLIPNDTEGKKPILLFVRPWHARRAYQTALEQTPQFKPVLRLCNYGGYNQGNWAQSLEYKAWMWSELKRLANPNKTGVIKPVDGFSDAALMGLHDRLESHLRQNGIDPARIARGAPGAGGATITEPHTHLLDYPHRVEKNPAQRERLAQLLEPHIARASDPAVKDNLTALLQRVRPTPVTPASVTVRKLGAPAPGLG